jgi:6-phosphogluconolactonase
VARSRQNEPTVVVLPDAEAVATATAERIADALAEAVAERGAAHWVTTGGSTPGAVYRNLVAPPLDERVPWDQVHLWWGDDRFVPADDPRSNAGLARAELLPRAPIPNSQVHPMPTGASIEAGEGPDECAARYAAEIRAAGLAESAGWPVFDVVMLGIGPDGHLLSVFPESAAFDRSDLVLGIPAPTHVEPHVARVTLNPRVLDVARDLLVVVHGGGKAEILGLVFGAERDERRWPAQVARRGGAIWLLDEAAAAHLPDEVR